MACLMSKCTTVLLNINFTFLPSEIVNNNFILFAELNAIFGNYRYLRTEVVFLAIKDVLSIPFHLDN